MKRKMFAAAAALLAAVLIAGFPAAVKGVPTVSAYGLEPEYTAEYDPDGIVLPLPHTGAGETYRPEVFAASDAAYASPLYGGKLIVEFERPGDYRLRYTVYAHGVQEYLYSRLRVADTTVPEFTLELKDSYNVGERIKVRPAVSDNTAHLAVFEYELMVNGKAREPQISNDRWLTLGTEGQYKLRVKVTDAGGNSAWRTYAFTVGDADGAGQTENKGLKWWAILLISAGSAAVAGGAAFAAVYLIKTKKKKPAAEVK